MNAKERFDHTRKSIMRLNAVNLAIMNGCEEWTPEGVKTSSDKSDPTAQKAIYNVDELAEKLAALNAEKNELETFIGESLAIIEGVRAGFGEVYANLLDRRYIDGEKWTAIHMDTGITRQYGNYLLDIAFDWIDSMGISRIIRGEFEI